MLVATARGREIPENLENTEKNRMRKLYPRAIRMVVRKRDFRVLDHSFRDWLEKKKDWFS